MSIRNGLRVAFALGALLAAGALDAAAPAHADGPGAWCAVAGGRSEYRNCGYFSLRQCVAAVSGVGTFCQPNPYFVPGQRVVYPIAYPR
jgi:hypothetical protein